MELQTIQTTNPFQNVIGLETIISDLKLIFKFENLKTNKKPFLILAYGAPGTGKTHTAATLAKMNGFHCKFLNSTTFMSKMQAESEDQLKEFILDAERRGPTLIIMDEADSILSERDNSRDNNSTQNVKALLLRVMDGLESPVGLTFFCTTNRPWCLDSAQSNRFKRKFHFPLPSIEEKFEYFEKCFQEEGQASSVTLGQFKSLGLELYSYRDISNLAHRSATYGPRTRTSHGKHFRVNKQGRVVACNCLQACNGRLRETFDQIEGHRFVHGSVTFDDVKKASTNYYPPTTREDIEKFENFEKGQCGVLDRDKKDEKEDEENVLIGDTYGSSVPTPRRKICLFSLSFVVGLGLMIYAVVSPFI